jgi:hypothetical protein
MDVDRFDDVLRQWGSSRRPVLGAGLGALLGLAGFTLTDAKKKKKKKKCKAPRVKCGKTCCAAGQTCQNGACTSACPAGQTRCNGTCQTGPCTPPCPAGQTRCNGVCVDTLTDGMNCGGCGRVCENVNSCQQGMCPLACPAGQARCNGGPCVDTTSNAENCGACPAGFGCQGGECSRVTGTCAAGQDSCAAGTPITCSVSSGVPGCSCVKDLSGATVCARAVPNMPCGCQTDAECQTREFPAQLGGGTYPNAFCLKTVSNACSTICPNNVCVIPCQRFHDGS